MINASLYIIHFTENAQRAQRCVIAAHKASECYDHMENIVKLVESALVAFLANSVFPTEFQIQTHMQVV